jgi:CubicO group peptidase (beta-lactamase class C family)
MDPMLCALNRLVALSLAAAAGGCGSGVSAMPEAAQDAASAAVIALPAAPARPVDPQGLAEALAAATADAAELPRLHSLLVDYRGQLVLERYFNGARPTRPANIKSASKSVLSALVGLAIDRGHLSGVDATLAEFFPDDLRDPDDAGKRQITVADLLTMQSGLESTSNRLYGPWVLSGNWIRYVLARPLLSPPGARMDYSTGNTHLLSAIVTKATGRSTWQFAQDVLARPLGISIPRWPRDPQGIYFGGNDMLMTPRDMLAFGRLYLQDGEANGRPIVPAAWVDASLAPRTVSRRGRGDRAYGYGWWISTLGGYRTFYAWGYGGQYIYLIPDLDLTIVTTSAATVSPDRRSHRRSLEEIVEQSIVGTVAALAGDAP